VGFMAAQGAGGMALAAWWPAMGARLAMGVAITPRLSPCSTPPPPHRAPGPLSGVRLHGPGRQRRADLGRAKGGTHARGERWRGRATRRGGCRCGGGGGGGLQSGRLPRPAAAGACWALACRAGACPAPVPLEPADATSGGPREGCCC
jgi:hypothetical protein